MRGFVPWGWTLGRISEHQDTRRTKVTGAWEFVVGRWQLPPGACAGTDGSGGEYSKDPRLRRCGWGVVVSTLHASDQPLATASGPVRGFQTVPRAELTALFWLARHTDGDADVAVDAKSVVDDFAKGPHGTYSSSQELWAELWNAIGTRAGKLHFVWAPPMLGRMPLLLTLSRLGPTQSIILQIPLLTVQQIATCPLGESQGLC